MSTFESTRKMKPNEAMCYGMGLAAGRDMTKTDVIASEGTEIQNGDRIEVYLPHTSIYSDLLLARGTVFFKHGSYRVRKEDAHEADCPRLDDFAPNCIINILSKEATR